VLARQRLFCLASDLDFVAAEGGYEVKVAGKAEESLTGKHIIVATGSSARALPGVPLMK